MPNRIVSAVMFCAMFAQSVPLRGQDAAAPTGAGRIQIVIVEGEGAINNVRQRVAREPIVQVEDENRRPIAGAAVTFLLPNQGASASFANGAQSLTITTDAQGRAVARGLRPNNVNGRYEIRVNASSQGRTASATISQTNALATAAVAGGISAKLIAILAVAGGAIAAGTVAATRGGDNGPGGPSPTVITPGSPTVGGPQ
ncbi:MAG TPA: carboxypeptidase-like regulatory domain-containing protein [Bryobacteraceae bacterium]|nr:carboxypeptidase-like regulatory domain-containing protein [Bryobacteraceae bacterium]